MLFDLRILLAACLATLIFAAAGLGLLAGLRSPFKSSSGYSAKDGPVFSGPGLPRSKQLPVVEANKPEVTGTIQTHVMQTPAVPVPAAPASKMPQETKPAPQAGAKSPSIATLIEEDQEAKAKSAAKTPAKKSAAKPKKKPHQARRPVPPRSNNPFSIFSNNNTTTAQ